MCQSKRRGFEECNLQFSLQYFARETMEVQGSSSAAGQTNAFRIPYTGDLKCRKACASHIWHHAQVASLWESKLATEPLWIRFAYGLIDHCHVSLPKAQLAPNVQLPKGRIWHWEPGTRMALAAHLAHMLQEGRPINSQARGVRDQKKLFRIKNKIKTLVSIFFYRNILRWWVGQKMSQNMFFWSGNGGIKML